MVFKKKQVPRYSLGDTRTYKKFAFVPKMMDDRQHIVWLEFYNQTDIWEQNYSEETRFRDGYYWDGWIPYYKSLIPKHS